MMDFDKVKLKQKFKNEVCKQCAEFMKCSMGRVQISLCTNLFIWNQFYEADKKKRCTTESKRFISCPSCKRNIQVW